MKVAGHLDRFASGRGFGHDVDVTISLQQDAQALPNDDMVFDQENGDSFHNNKLTPESRFHLGLSRARCFMPCPTLAA
jgi:hypothetical protein